MPVPEADCLIPGDETVCLFTVWLVSFLTYPLDRAGDGANEGAVSMSFGVTDQESLAAVIFEGARGVGKPARAPAKGAGEMVGERERRGVIAARRARRIRKDELLSRGLEEEYVSVLYQGELQRTGRTVHVEHRRGEAFTLPGEDKPAQVRIPHPGKYAGGNAVAIGIDVPINPASRIGAGKMFVLGLGSG